MLCEPFDVVSVNNPTAPFPAILTRPIVSFKYPPPPHLIFDSFSSKENLFDFTPLPTPV